MSLFSIGHKHRSHQIGIYWKQSESGNRWRPLVAFMKPKRLVSFLVVFSLCLWVTLKQGESILTELVSLEWARLIYIDGESLENDQLGNTISPARKHNWTLWIQFSGENTYIFWHQSLLHKLIATPNLIVRLRGILLFDRVNLPDALDTNCASCAWLFCIGSG